MWDCQCPINVPSIFLQTWNFLRSPSFDSLTLVVQAGVWQLYQYKHLCTKPPTPTPTPPRYRLCFWPPPSQQSEAIDIEWPGDSWRETRLWCFAASNQLWWDLVQKGSTEHCHDLSHSCKSWCPFQCWGGVTWFSGSVLSFEQRINAWDLIGNYSSFGAAGYPPETC